jgi:hypothetical protein
MGLVKYLAILAIHLLKRKEAAVVAAVGNV